jgi:hypothetical protein
MMRGKNRMLEINEEIVKLIENDSNISSLLGSTISDSRVYAWYPLDNLVFSDTTPAAILYRDSMGSRPYRWSYPKQMPNLFIYFRVCSIYIEKANQVAESLINLFDKTNISIDNWSIKWIELVSKTQGMPEGTPTKLVYSVNTSFRFTNVFRR